MTGTATRTGSATKGGITIGSPARSPTMSSGSARPRCSGISASSPGGCSPTWCASGRCGSTCSGRTPARGCRRSPGTRVPPRAGRPPRRRPPGSSSSARCWRPPGVRTSANRMGRRSGSTSTGCGTCAHATARWPTSGRWHGSPPRSGCPRPGRRTRPPGGSSPWTCRPTGFGTPSGSTGTRRGRTWNATCSSPSSPSSRRPGSRGHGRGSGTAGARCWRCACTSPSTRASGRLRGRGRRGQSAQPGQAG
ncbi:hypothetical protein ACUXK4_004515 [Methylorubrum extorquens]